MAIPPSSKLSDHIEYDALGIIADYVSNPQALAHMGAADLITRARHSIFTAYLETPSLERYVRNAEVLYPGTSEDLERITAVQTSLLSDSCNYKILPEIDPNEPFDILLLDQHSKMVEAVDFIAFFEELEKQVPEAREYNLNLQILDPVLKAKALQTWMHENAGLFSHIVELDLSDLNLKFLPTEIDLLTELKILDLADNQLMAIPDSIGKLTRLTDLCLRRNRLSSVPDSIGNLTNLRRLMLSNNIIRKLPDSIEKLTELRRLGLNDNLLKELPENIGNLSQLERLNISNNQIERLPNSMEKITEITGLFLDANLINLEDIPPHLIAAMGP